MHILMDSIVENKHQQMRNTHIAAARASEAINKNGTPVVITLSLDLELLCLTKSI